MPQLLLRSIALEPIRRHAHATRGGTMPRTTTEVRWARYRCGCRLLLRCVTLERQVVNVVVERSKKKEQESGRPAKLYTLHFPLPPPCSLEPIRRHAYATRGGTMSRTMTEVRWARYRIPTTQMCYSRATGRECCGRARKEEGAGEWKARETLYFAFPVTPFLSPQTDSATCLCHSRRDDAKDVQTIA